MPCTEVTHLWILERLITWLKSITKEKNRWFIFLARLLIEEPKKVEKDSYCIELKRIETKEIKKLERTREMTQKFYYKLLDDKVEHLVVTTPSHEKIDYLFNRTDSTLSISGGYGCAIFCWGSNRNTLQDIADCSKNLGHFMSKACGGDNLWDYDYDILEEELDDYLGLSDTSEDDYSLSREQRQKLKGNLIENWRGKYGYQIDSYLEEKLIDFDPAWWETLPEGKDFSDFVIAYARGLQMWLEQD